MENSKTKPILTALLIGTTLSSGLLMIKNKVNKEEAAKEKSVLITEKDQLNRELNAMALDKKKVVDLNVSQKFRIDSLSNVIEVKNGELQRLMAENANAKDLKKKIAELDYVRTLLKQEVEHLKYNAMNMENSNKGLQKELETLRMENERLYADLMLARSTNSNNIFIKSVKRNQKITAIARLTKVIDLSFDFPESQTQNLEVSILTPDGKSYTTLNKNLVSVSQSKDPAMEIAGIPQKRMELNFRPEKKFKKGIYKFTVFNGIDPVTTIQVQLK